MIGFQKTRFQSLVLAFLFVFGFVFLSSGFLSATIQGVVYNSDLQPQKNAIVEVDTTPIQRVVSSDGTYSIDIPEGNYKIKAMYDGLYAEETLDVRGVGKFSLDLILLPEIEDINIDVLEEVTLELDEERNVLGLWVFLIVVVFIAIGFSISQLYKHKIKRKIEKGIELSEDLNKIVNILNKKEGRMKQRDLGKLLNWSDAKLSLALTELENMGVVKRIKKGRGNIIVLKKGK